MTALQLAVKLLRTALTDSGYTYDQTDKTLVKALAVECAKSIDAGAKWSAKDIEDLACGEKSDQERVAAAKANGKAIDLVLSSILDDL